MGNLRPLRLSTTINPLGLRVGERIKVARIAFVGFGDDFPHKKLTFSEEMTFTCTVVGIAKRALGKYIRGHVHQSLDGDDWEGPRLEVSKYVRLYECKISLEDKPFYVHPDDVMEVI